MGSSTGDICAAHGECVLKEEKAECACYHGFQGADCAAECPRDVHGEVCGGHGACTHDGDSNSAICNCEEGYDGPACTIACPGVQKDGVACSGNGVCDINEEDKTAVCNCVKTHMGRDCQYACPMDPHSDLACGGDDRGTCVRDNTVLPDKTSCDCKSPYVGKTSMCDAHPTVEKSVAAMASASSKLK